MNRYVHTLVQLRTILFTHTDHTLQTNESDPPHMSHMSLTQPHMHGNSTGGLATNWFYHLPPHLSSHTGLALHGMIARSQLPYGSADELEGDRHGVGKPSTRSLQLAKQPVAQRPALCRSAFLIIVTRGSKHKHNNLFDPFLGSILGGRMTGREFTV